MIKLNDNFSRLTQSYLFSEIAAIVAEYKRNHPDKQLIRMDIGDVTRPLPKACIEAMRIGLDNLSTTEKFKGYGPEQGYPFLRESICKNDYHKLSIDIEPDEVFVSDGAKCDLANLGNLYGDGTHIAINNPGYPVYIDDAVMDGRKITLLPCTKENGFIPDLPTERPDVIILCFPGNPTGVSISKEELQKWVDYARKEQVLILFDSAYVAFVETPGAIRSIYECEGAREVAIEVRSFSKTAGFTGMRCGYTVVPKQIKGYYSDGKEELLNNLWRRRQATKFNGASYLSQVAAAAIYSEEGQKQVMETINYYHGNARIIKEKLEQLGMTVYGGIDSPYVWCEVPAGFTSREYYRYILDNAALSCTPGVGFGQYGEGYIRMTGFNTRENTIEAMRRLSEIELKPNS